MGTEELRNIALKDNNLGVGIVAKSFNDISHTILEINTPEVDSRVWVVEGDLENAAILSCLEAAILGEIESRGSLNQGSRKGKSLEPRGNHSEVS